MFMQQKTTEQEKWIKIQTHSYVEDISVIKEKGQRKEM